MRTYSVVLDVWSAADNRFNSRARLPMGIRASCKCLRICMRGTVAQPLLQGLFLLGEMAFATTATVET